jgi:phosphate:Na+ symporter
MLLKLPVTARILIVFAFLYSSFAFAQSNEVTQLDWFTMFMWLAGGLSLFLFGMDQLVKGLLVVAGDKMKNMLARLTTNRVMGAITGAGITAVIQSSSVTSVLVVGFVSAGLITVGQAAGVIMGANLGTTITAQIVAFKVTNFALLMIAVGFIIQFVAKLRKKKAIGDLVMGLGLIFFGMNTMSEGMEPLRDYQPFLDLMSEMQNPFLGLLVGLVFTALVQSSSATIAIVIVMASNGFLTLPAGIALSLGADIGTTITAMLATIGKSREALRTAMIHVQFNILGVLLWLPFIPELANLATYISAHEAFDNGTISTLAANTPREIANANTLFKLTALILFLPLVPAFLWVVYKIFPVLPEEKNNKEFKAEFLDMALFNTPSLAMNAVYLELEHYQKQVGLFYKRLVSMINSPNIVRLSKEDMTIQRLRSYQGQMIAYLGQAGQAELTEEEQKEYMKLVNVVNNLEAMLDAIHSHLQQVLHEMIQENIKPSETMLNLVGQLTSEVAKSMENALRSIYAKDNEAAMSVIAIKKTIDHLIQDALKHQVKRFKADKERLKVFRYEMQLVDGFKQLHTLSKRIASLQLDSQNDNEQPVNENIVDIEKEQ